MLNQRCRLYGVDIEMIETPLEMPWGSVYWLIEARMERPILPNIFRRIGEKEWASCEPTLDAALQKIDEYMQRDLR